MKKSLIILNLLLLFSCNFNISSSDLYVDFEDYRWYQNQNISFEIEVVENQEMWFHFRHIYDYILPNIAVEISVEKLDEKTFEKTFTEVILIKDENGTELGNCTGDICDVYQKLNLNLEVGKYKITFTNAKVSEYLPNVIGVGYQLRNK